MKKGILKKLFACMLSATVATVSFPAETEFETKAAEFSEQGYQDGLDWELWYSYDGQGTGEMELTGNGGFIAEWNDVQEYMARTGIKWDLKADTPSYANKYYEWEENGNIIVNYDVDYRPEGCSTLCAFGYGGYQVDFQFYIVENYSDWDPAETIEYVDDIEVDGITYDVYKSGFHDISGITYKTYYSVRRDDDKSSSGAINVTGHFDEWKKLELTVPDSIQEVSLLVYGFDSTGYAEVKKNYITIDGEPVNKKSEESDEPEIISGECGKNASFTLDEKGTLTVSGTGNISFGCGTGESIRWDGYIDSIKKVIIQDGITSVGDNAFSESTSLYSVTIPKSVLEIGEFAFNGCTMLNSVIIENPDCIIPMSDDTINNGIESDSSGSKQYDLTIYGYAGSTAEKYALENDIPFKALDETSAARNIKGDANCDGTLSIADVASIYQALGNSDKYSLSEQGLVNADIADNGNGITVNDAIMIQRLITDEAL